MPVELPNSPDSQPAQHLRRHHADTPLPPITDQETIVYDPDHDRELYLRTGDVYTRGARHDLVIGMAYGGEWLITWNLNNHEYTTFESQDFGVILTDADSYTLIQNPFRLSR